MSKPVGLEDSLYDEVAKLTETDPISYPSIKNFVDRAVQKELEALKQKK